MMMISVKKSRMTRTYGVDPPTTLRECLLSNMVRIRSGWESGGRYGDSPSIAVVVLESIIGVA